ncbi:Tetratricopeptide repeat-containing protein [Salinibacillus kushneri]|uniref:Tetratricopeptide repeat-containing protein n=1 Tax=Salinibacillus kushneri TaxID=237682 RepID=A0A1I0H1I9_9BACI|nr:tetratricopeptide repeat protein [Salinibacillus kushneri]SET77439.1 Tetratricopeptide repeat-containing protein [Salinibacillus kushneri]
MNKKHQDVVIFPGWKKELEQDGLEALKEKRYEDALENILLLEEFEAASYEILTGKVICYIELGRYDEAIALCRKLMKEDEENYYKYLHIYITVLFQTSQYDEITSLLDEIFSTEEIPYTYREQFQQIYDLSQNFNQDYENEHNDKEIQYFLHNLEGGSFQEQWRLLSLIRKKPVEDYVEDFIPYFSDTDLNPVLKTGLLQWFMEQGIDREIEIDKFKQMKMVNPKELSDILDQSFAQEVIKALDWVEQQDPTLFEFTKQILFRFLYVYFPFLPNDKDRPVITDAILSLAVEYLQMDDQYSLDTDESDEREYWKNEIKELEKKYFSQIE